MGPLEFPAWDPVLLDLPGPIDVRWYGLMYIVGFVCAQFILVRLAKARFLPIEPERCADFIFYTVFGTILGGRLGYALFYDQGLVDPIKILKVWEGGLSFHGGLIGVSVSLVLFARRHKVPMGRVIDSAALATTPGIFAVRMANFINGELYGRVCEATATFAMRFPTDPTARRLLQVDRLGDKRAQELGIRYAYGKVEWETVAEHLPETTESGRAIDWEPVRASLDWEKVKDGVDPRHPSQLYEGFGEGLFVGLLLFVVYRLTRKKPLPPWTFGGIFLIGYGVVRFFIENYRQPDEQFRNVDEGDTLGTVLFGLTMGQVLCVAMIAAGILMIWGGRVAHRRRPDPEAVSA